MRKHIRTLFDLLFSILFVAVIREILRIIDNTKNPLLVVLYIFFKQTYDNMSLDVYLKGPNPVVRKGTGVFIRDNGETRELSEQEVKEKWPDSDITESEFEDEYVYSDNITHNLNVMAKEAGIYEALWIPEELSIRCAGELVDYLLVGLNKLKNNPEHYKSLNPPNGWGTYEQLVGFVENYLEACVANPEAEIQVCR